MGFENSGMSISDSKWDHYKNLESFVAKCYVEIDQHTSFLTVLSSILLSGDKDHLCGKKIFILHVISLEDSWPEWHLFFILLDAPCLSYETTKCHHHNRQNGEMCAWISFLLHVDPFHWNWYVSVTVFSFVENEILLKMCSSPLTDRESRHLLHRNCSFSSSTKVDFGDESSANTETGIRAEWLQYFIRSGR